MDALSALLGAIVGGLITYFLQRDNHQHELKKINEENKTEFMAETTVKHYLKSEKFTDRSFETLKSHIGGFEDNELRKILVRAGAIRLFREDKSEWWRLLERNEEAYAKKRQRDGKKTD